MPELPDISCYREALSERIVGQRLTDVRIKTPFLLRSIHPPPSDLIGRRSVAVRRIGKRIAIGFEDDRWMVIHLMIAGRLHWKPPGSPLGSKAALAAFDFESGTLTFTEAGTKRRASLHLAITADIGAAFDRGGLDPFTTSLEEFAAGIRAANHTIKRTLTDPTVMDGIGNAYSDEILHAARLSPIKLSQRLTDDEIARLWTACREVLALWIDRLNRERHGEFPEKVTAFRPEMAVHGKFGQPCPVCGTPIHRIRYADNETNYCARCQTEGRLLADRALSRLLKKDWPRSLDELDQ